MMSEVMLNVIDGERSIHGHLPGCMADTSVAALSADPETIDELSAALGRFMDETTAGGAFSNFLDGVREEHHDSGLVIIDLSAKLVAAEWTYTQLLQSGQIQYHDGCSATEHWVPFHLPHDWKLLDSVEGWRPLAEERRRQIAARPRIDARAVLLGRPLVEFIAAEYPQVHDCHAVKEVHERWLMTPRADLADRSPREVLLEHRHTIDLELQDRSEQWSQLDACPPGLLEESAAYRYAGFGTHQIVVYYDLVRFLVEAHRERVAKEGQIDPSQEITRLERLCKAWLEEPDPDMHGRTPAALMDLERRRIPLGFTAAEAAVDFDDCPLCQMMAEEVGPHFVFLDGSHMDADFAFSFCATRREWELERTDWDLSPPAEGSVDKPRDSVWQSSFSDEECLDGLPPGQLVPLVLFGIGAQLSELNHDIKSLESDVELAQARVEGLNRQFGNLREAFATSAELIDPMLDRLEEEVATAAECYPAIEEKCADLQRQIQELSGRLVQSLASSVDDEPDFDDNVPF